ncbi:TIGR03620 family F420-dependent LLM class oxidoreductase [Amycolatopsis saalfeldensis]|uniref:Probable F420-dependent oxidoreductase, MSMEG_4141 family n=1 Tax=Amycolatopsis saalfeldensis TaxID=394193 RepID=A0A1H8YGQ6_9PSEU|nr:TIGR03620 family F420-dependent LLM class oxidoreductase [Amycolatopsis saalfeldensis]SEP51243.1 probable F420-dependent oxidoreductase, MSMEG_4141 family [Amycolatopsis saalfeldensis]
MNTTEIEAARKALGPVGVCLPVEFTTALDIGAQREAVRRLEAAGYGAVWTNEVIGGKDVLAQLAVLLAATERMVFGTSIANIWAREPQTAHGGAALLAQAYPGRIVLGLGVGYPEQAAGTGREFGRPLATMRDYVTRMDAPTWPPAPAAGYPRIIAANGPKMLALAGEVADGALPAGAPAEQTALARTSLGPDKLLVVGLSVVPDADAGRETARERVTEMLARPGTSAGLVRLGYSEEDVRDVSDRLVDALIAHGGPAAVAAKAREHLAAGADHVTVLLSPGTGFATGVDRLEQLAPALTEVTRLA